LHNASLLFWSSSSIVSETAIYFSGFWKNKNKFQISGFERLLFQDIPEL